MDGKSQVFISHVSHDRDAALKIVAQLEERGIKCWIAPRDVPPGDYNIAIVNAIDQSAAMLLVFSSKCNDNGNILRELTVAGDVKKLIIPVRIEDATPKGGLRYPLANLQRIDAFPDLTPAVDELERRLRHESPNVPASSPRDQNSTRRRLIVTIAAASILVASGIAGLIQYSNAKKTFIADVQEALCLPSDGIAHFATIVAVGDYLMGTDRSPPARIDITSAELRPALQAAIRRVGSCVKAGYENAFEVGYFGVSPDPGLRIRDFQQKLNIALKDKNSSATIPLTGSLDGSTREAIANFRKLSGTPKGGDGVDLQLLKSVMSTY